MHSWYLLSFLTLSTLILAGVTATVTQGGITKIYGNSFGIPGVNATYDYIVIGGGTAGNTVAARLAQDPANYSVAVIEAGSFYEILNGNHSQVPGYSYTSAQANTAASQSMIQWVLETAPQAKSCDFTPPNYEKISPRVDISFDPDAFLPNAGPLQVSYGNYQYLYVTPYSRGLESLGFPPLAGINSGILVGYSAGTNSIGPRTATRSSSETSFLQSAAGTTSIQLYPNALAKRILFNAHKRATSVVIQAASSLQNFTYTLSANKEIILSAGADHPFMALSYKVNALTGTQIAADNAAYNEDVVQQYINNQSGPLSTTGSGQAIAFEKFPTNLRKNFSNSTRAFLDTFPSDWPEAEYLDLVYAAFPDNISSTDNYLLIGAALLSTSSRGNMTIRSADTLDQPVISPNWLLDKSDQEQAIAAFLRIREIATASGIVESEYQPGANVRSRADILDWLKNNMSPIYHAASSCKMGRANDTTAVVDSHARVRGVSNLRVVDASAFPILPPGQPQSTMLQTDEIRSDPLLPPLMSSWIRLGLCQLVSRPKFQDSKKTTRADPLRVDHQLGLANTMLESGDNTAEDTLLLLIDQCENHRRQLSSQMLRARCILITFYQRQDDRGKGFSALEQAREAVHKTLELNIEKSEGLLRAYVEVGKLCLESYDEEAAEDILQSVAESAVDATRTVDSANIGILIHIGKLYQNRNTWAKAEPWFERALAASMATGDLESPLTVGLEAALENRHYSSTCEQNISFSLDEIQRIKHIL
ncbi:MAG: hypothetical protein Q9225_004387 [Loekoesia sp. 1 TL-2023]